MKGGTKTPPIPFLHIGETADETPSGASRLKGLLGAAVYAVASVCTLAHVFFWFRLGIDSAAEVAEVLVEFDPFQLPGTVPPLHPLHPEEENIAKRSFRFRTILHNIYAFWTGQPDVLRTLARKDISCQGGGLMVLKFRLNHVKSLNLLFILCAVLEPRASSP